VQSRLDTGQIIHSAAGKLADQRVTRSFGERPIIAKPLAFRNAEPAQAFGQGLQIMLFREEDNIVAVPMLNSRISDHQRSNIVDCYITSAAKLLPPIFKRLLVDVVFAALAWDGGRKHDKRAVVN
jgi:hypothetical protein